MPIPMTINDSVRHENAVHLVMDFTTLFMSLVPNTHDQATRGDSKTMAKIATPDIVPL